MRLEYETRWCLVSRTESASKGEMMETPRPDLKPLIDAINEALKQSDLMTLALFHIKDQLYDMGAR
jgi:hypothetical protein